jgi:hypothetical protein
MSDLPALPSPTQNEDTENRYTVVGWRRLHAYANDTNISPLCVEPIRFVEWLIDQQPTWKPATWRQYKAAVGFLLQNYYPRETEALQLLMSTSQANCRRSGVATSDKKRKSLPPEPLAMILQHLKGSRSQYARHLQYFLVATILTGLRRIEWFGASIVTDDDGTNLIVKNGKSTNGRSHGKNRTLNIGHFDRTHIQVIKAWIKMVQNHPSQKSYQKMITAMGAVFRRVNLAIWQKSKLHYTLSSCRHQAAANLKLIYSPKEVAAMMGHAVDDTAVTHYARRSAGKTMLSPTVPLALPIPAQDEVDRVRSGRAFRPLENIEVENDTYDTPDNEQPTTDESDFSP